MFVKSQPVQMQMHNLEIKMTFNSPLVMNLSLQHLLYRIHWEWRGEKSQWKSLHFLMSSCKRSTSIDMLALTWLFTYGSLLLTRIKVYYLWTLPKIKVSLAHCSLEISVVSVESGYLIIYRMISQFCLNDRILVSGDRYRTCSSPVRMFSSE